MSGRDVVGDGRAPLRDEGRDLDEVVDTLTQDLNADQLLIKRLKKRKLWLRDRISFIEDQITPDIIA